MTWMDTAAELRGARVPAVLVTLASVRGHAPREAGAKMIVTADGLHGTIGGGNLEMTALTRARELLDAEARAPEMLTLRLNDKAPAKYGRQCCGGEVNLLLEPLPVPAAVAIFGVGNIGLELARILSRHDIDLHLSDSRPELLAELDRLEAGVANIARSFSMVGEEVLVGLPAGTHVLIMTHDHAEDLHLCDAALRRGDLGSIGLIGSSAKWQRFRKNLIADGHEPALVDTIDCPIGLPELTGKSPATIALSVAAKLISTMG
ncbi:MULTISPECIES: xanthine dehydrogenase accessory protein XdhC [unclassified Brevibacterium]|uniref:xanthine dehydrogenase accessory protein XdhC n=1 Tax=unclassified Brevibacterium TaxID=2614124 RepID=UPI001E49144E|nr:MULTISPECIES: xanthine dehydrogenase accessory protein XdhC [unclassified Brevibacterium]MDK8436855.1 xanthine dehydrogenase accessory protein XdhC [Brevibacterium sp. H-BE7]